MMNYTLSESELTFLNACDDVEANIVAFLMTGNHEYRTAIAQIRQSYPEPILSLRHTAHGILFRISETLGLKPKGKFTDLLRQIEQQFDIERSHQTEPLLDIDSLTLKQRQGQILNILKGTEQ